MQHEGADAGRRDPVVKEAQQVTAKADAILKAAADDMQAIRERLRPSAKRGTSVSAPSSGRSPSGGRQVAAAGPSGGTPRQRGKCQAPPRSASAGSVGVPSTSAAAGSGGGSNRQGRATSTGHTPRWNSAASPQRMVSDGANSSPVPAAGCGFRGYSPGQRPSAVQRPAPARLASESPSRPPA